VAGRLAPDLRQLVLDEHAGMVRGREVRNPLGYLHTLIQVARAGRFVPTIAFRVAQARQEALARAEGPAPGPGALLRQDPDPAARLAAREHLARMRAQLGMGRRGKAMSCAGHSECSHCEHSKPEKPATGATAGCSQCEHPRPTESWRNRSRPAWSWRNDWRPLAQFEPTRTSMNPPYPDPPCTPLPDGYDLEAERLALADLLQAEQPDESDPRWPRVIEYTDRLRQLRQMQTAWRCARARMRWCRTPRPPSRRAG
jgi:hypothetical protein